MNNQNVQPGSQQPVQDQTPKQSSAVNSEYSKFDEKTMATIKTSAIWGAVASLIMSIAGMLASYFFFKNVYSSTMGIYGQYFGGSLAPRMINIPVLLNDLVWGAIGGAVTGYVIAKFYSVFIGWQKKFIGNKLNSFFKILFWPYIVGIALNMILTGALSAIYSGFSSFIIMIIADVAATYLYAKMMDKNVGKYYKQASK